MGRPRVIWAVAALWPLASPASPSIPCSPVTIRLGPPQRVAALNLTCPAGLVVFDGSGVPVLAQAPSLAVRAGSASDGDRERGSSGASPAATNRTPSQPHLILEYGPDGSRGQGLTLPLTSLDVRPMDPAVPVEHGGKRWRGGVWVEPGADGMLRVTHVLSLEDYVRGVLPGEMPPSAPFEALKAQAVVARTYAVRSRGRHAADGFDLCTTEHCQVYGGPACERSATDGAVRATEGQILVYGGRPILAYYHATCGGATDSPAEVWGPVEDAPYLAGVPDYAPAPGEEIGSVSAILSLALRPDEVFCGGARDFCWEFEWSREEVERALARMLPVVLRRPAPLGELRRILVTRRSPNGRVSEVQVEGSEGVHSVRGDSIRRLFAGLGPARQGLPSTRFVVRAADAPPGTAADTPPERYRIIGFGHGHGVGLCQSGAIGRARRGERAEEILQHYYPGAVLDRVTAVAP